MAPKPKKMQSLWTANREEVWQELLPYLALGWAPATTPTVGFLCALYALEMSLNAVRILNEDLDPEKIHIDIAEIREIFRSQEYKDFVKQWAVENSKSKLVPEGDDRISDFVYKEFMEVNWLGPDQLACVLEMINQKYNLSYRLGFICKGRGNANKRPTATIFGRPNQPFSDGPVLWLYTYGNDSHWEGIVPAQEVSTRRGNDFDEWDVQDRIEAMVNQGLYLVTKPVLKATPGISNPQMELVRGQFVVRAQAPPGWSPPMPGVFWGQLPSVRSIDAKDTEGVTALEGVSNEVFPRVGAVARDSVRQISAVVPPGRQAGRPVPKRKPALATPEPTPNKSSAKKKKQKEEVEDDEGEDEDLEEEDEDLEEEVEVKVGKKKKEDDEEEDDEEEDDEGEGEDLEEEVEVKSVKKKEGAKKKDAKKKDAKKKDAKKKDAKKKDEDETEEDNNNGGGGDGDDDDDDDEDNDNKKQTGSKRKRPRASGQGASRPKKRRTSLKKVQIIIESDTPELKKGSKDPLRREPEHTDPPQTLRMYFATTAYKPTDHKSVLLNCTVNQLLLKVNHEDLDFPRMREIDLIEGYVAVENLVRIRRPFGIQSIMPTRGHEDLDSRSYMQLKTIATKKRIAPTSSLITCKRAILEDKRDKYLETADDCEDLEFARLRANYIAKRSDYDATLRNATNNCRYVLKNYDHGDGTWDVTNVDGYTARVGEDVLVDEPNHWGIAVEAGTTFPQPANPDSPEPAYPDEDTEDDDDDAVDVKKPKNRKGVEGRKAKKSKSPSPKKEEDDSIDFGLGDESSEDPLAGDAPDDDAPADDLDEDLGYGLGDNFDDDLDDDLDDGPDDKAASGYQEIDATIQCGVEGIASSLTCLRNALHIVNLEIRTTASAAERNQARVIARLLEGHIQEADDWLAGMDRQGRRLRNEASPAGRPRARFSWQNFLVRLLVPVGMMFGTVVGCRLLTSIKGAYASSIPGSSGGNSNLMPSGYNIPELSALLNMGSKLGHYITPNSSPSISRKRKFDETELEN